MHHLSPQNATSIFYVPAVGCVYLNNPKAGCSTVLTSLWRAHDKLLGIDTFRSTPHRTEQSPFIREPPALTAFIDELREARWFSVVRNPYTRVLSAYLDKFLGDRDPNVLRPFRVRYGWPAEREPTFSEFLRIIVEDGPETLDPHFRPQTHLLLLPYTPIDFVGHVERMHEAEQWMNQMCSEIQVRDHRPHATGANSKLQEHYDTTTVELVQRLYEDDFATFGYSMDPAQLEPDTANVPRSDVVLDFLATMVGTEDERRRALERLHETLDLRLPWLAQHGISTRLERDGYRAVCQTREAPDCSWRTSKILGVD